MPDNKDQHSELTSDKLQQMRNEDMARRAANADKKLGGYTKGAIEASKLPDDSSSVDQTPSFTPVPSKEPGAVQQPARDERSVVDMHGRAQGVPEPGRFSGRPASKNVDVDQ